MTKENIITLINAHIKDSNKTTIVDVNDNSIKVTVRNLSVPDNVVEFYDDYNNFELLTKMSELQFYLK